MIYVIKRYSAISDVYHKTISSYKNATSRISNSVGNVMNKNSVGRLVWNNRKPIGSAIKNTAITTGVTYGLMKGMNSISKKSNKKLLEEYKRDLDSYEDMAKKKSDELKKQEETQKSYSMLDTVMTAASIRSSVRGARRDKTSLSKRQYLSHVNEMKKAGGVMSKIGDFARKNPKLALGTTAVVTGMGLGAVSSATNKVIGKGLKKLDKSAFDIANPENPYANLQGDLDKINEKYGLTKTSKK